jgi:hypothetical protein
MHWPAVTGWALMTRSCPWELWTGLPIQTGSIHGRGRGGMRLQVRGLGSGMQPSKRHIIGEIQF